MYSVITCFFMAFYTWVQRMQWSFTCLLFHVLPEISLVCSLSQRKLNSKGYLSLAHKVWPWGSTVVRSKVEAWEKPEFFFFFSFSVPWTASQIMSGSPSWFKLLLDGNFLCGSSSYLCFPIVWTFVHCWWGCRMVVGGDAEWCNHYGQQYGGSLKD